MSFGATKRSISRVASASSAFPMRHAERLAARGLEPQWVFVPTRFNLHEIVAAFARAAALGCGAFLTGPLTRLGRAAHAWPRSACTDEDGRQAVAARSAAAATTGDTPPQWS